MSPASACGCPARYAPIQTAYVIHSRTACRTLQFAVTTVGHEPRITVVADDSGVATVGGFVGLRDVRRVARAVANGTARTYLGLRPWGELPGGRLSVEQDGDDVYFVTAPLNGRPTLFGPLAATTVATVCRDVVGWNRLLARAADPSPAS